MVVFLDQACGIPAAFQPWVASLESQVKGFHLVLLMSWSLLELGSDSLNCCLSICVLVC